MTSPLFFPYINATLPGCLSGIVSPGIKQSYTPKHAYTYISIAHYYPMKPHPYQDILHLIKLPLKTPPRPRPSLKTGFGCPLNLFADMNKIGLSIPPVLLKRLHQGVWCLHQQRNRNTFRERSCSTRGIFFSFSSPCCVGLFVRFLRRKMWESQQKQP